MIRLADLFPVILVSMCVAFAAAPALIRLARRLRLVDMPGAQPHKWHSDPTPLAGGLILALALAIDYLVVIPRPGRATLGILLAAALMLIWGVWDDRKNLPAWGKLIGQILAAAILWRQGVFVHLFAIEWLNFLLSVLWVVGMINAFNFMDSMDGLALGLAAIGAAFFMLVTIDSGQPQLAFLCAAVLGATVGASFYNVSPAKMFIGDSGAELLGLLLAAIGLAYVPVGLDKAVSWFTPILVLGIPVFNITLVVISRVRRGVRFYEAHRDHLAHRLVDLGLDQSRTVMLIQLGAIALGLLAFIALRLQPLPANALFALIVVGGLGAILLLEKRRGRDV